MKSKFVKTKNYLRFAEAIERFEERGAEETRLIIVDGDPGLGKTTILQRWASAEHCAYLRAKTDWTPRWFLEELLKSLQVNIVPFSYPNRFNMALAELSSRTQDAEVAGKQFAVVLDESDYITNKSQLVETIRDLADIAGATFILVGMGRIRDNLTKFPQTASRVNGYVRFEPADIDDVKLFFKERCEVKIADDLAGFIHNATQGYNRELLEAVKSVERFGFRLTSYDEAIGLTLKEMSGQFLINNRKNGQPIHVPGRI